MVTRALLILTALGLAAPGCARAHAGSRCASGPAKLEVKDGTGQLELALRPSADADKLDLCDGTGRRLGAVARRSNVVALFGPENRLQLRLLDEGAGTLRGTGPRGTLLKAHTTGSVHQLLGPSGQPIGTLRSDVVDDASGHPVARVARAGAGAILRRPDGRVDLEVSPVTSLQAAGAFALDRLPLPERTALYLFWSR